jgi:hypothetical protein
MEPFSMREGGLPDTTGQRLGNPWPVMPCRSHQTQIRTNRCIPFFTARDCFIARFLTLLLAANL